MQLNQSGDNENSNGLGAGLNVTAKVKVCCTINCCLCSMLEVQRIHFFSLLFFRTITG
ncbi:hypothetical protein BC826DRAFT_1042053 [Russula brevipes]|nr:hypothetical protein BC826DRAFT_1042053 [Russula brevipes]